MIGSSSRPKNVVSAPNGTVANAANAADDRQDRRQREEPLVGALRPQFLLEQQLEDVGDRLQHAVRPDQVRAVALLHEAHDLALGEHQDRRRDDQHEEDEADQRAAAISIHTSRPT